MPSAMRWRRGAALIVFVYFALGIFVVSLPEPGKLRDRSRWDTDRTRREFGRWGAPFGANAEAVEAVLWPLAQGTATVVEILRAPFQPATRYLGFFQSWRMFSVPRLVSARLAVDVREGGEWRTIYVSRSRERDWRRRQFDHDRMRKLVARAVRKAEGGHWTRLGRWIARRAAADFPAAVEARVRSEEVVIPTVSDFIQGAEPTISLKAERVFRLELYR